MARSRRSGRPAKVKASAKSLTGAYLSGRAAIPVPEKRRAAESEAAMRRRSSSKARGSIT